MRYASEFIAVTVPPVDVAVIVSSSATVTMTVQSYSPAAQENVISP